jgi:ArsR family transcriptional regulator
MNDACPPNLDQSLMALRAAAEETRLRILALLAEGELSVSDLTDILGQSQPRISRHLKLLVEAGLVERHREGAWAFFRLSDRGAGARLMRPLLEGLDRADPQLADDRARLAAVRQQRAQNAQSFFARLAPEWDRVRSLHAPEAAVEAAVLDALGPRPVRDCVDLGTGTGRMLQLLAPRASRAVGLDASHAMLSVARANLEKAGLTRIELRQGDIYAPPFPRHAFDLVVIHQVLHYLGRPRPARSAEAAAPRRPGGRLHRHRFRAHARVPARAPGPPAARLRGDQVAGLARRPPGSIAPHREVAPLKRRGLAHRAGSGSARPARESPHFPLNQQTGSRVCRPSHA